MSRSSSSSDIHVPLPSAGPSRASYTSLHSLKPEIIVIGAGIAGSSLSYSLASGGRRVLLLERDLSPPDRIVGELLQPGGVAALHKLGLGHCLEGIDATPVEGYCVVKGSREVEIPYPMMEVMAGDRRMERGKGKEREEERINGHADGSAEANEGEGEVVGLRKRRNGVANGVENGANGHTNGNGNGNGHGHPDGPPTWHVPNISGKKEGRSFHHGRLINALRQSCLSEPSGNLTVLEATVRDLVFCEHTNRVIGVSAAFKLPASAPADTAAQGPSGGEEKITKVRKIYAPLVIIADGCFSKFRSLPGSRIPPTQTRSHFVGVVLKDAPLPRKYHGTVCLTPAGPVLLYQIGDEAEETRMLVDVKGKLPSVADGSLKNFIEEQYLPHLPPSLHDSVRIALNQRLRTMPNSFLPPSLQGSTTPAGVIMVGDAWNMRHPLTGGGMTVAFNDAVMLSDYLGVDRLGKGREGLEDWGKISEGLREWFWKRKNLAGTINVLSMALYDLFGGAEEPDLEVLREGCFRYFELGGDCVAGPVGLLSALTPKPLLLFYHFFSVAFYSIWILLTSGMPSDDVSRNKGVQVWEVPGLFLYSFKVFWTACVVLLPMIFTEFRT